MVLRIAVYSALVCLVAAIPVDNGVEGKLTFGNAPGETEENKGACESADRWRVERAWVAVRHQRSSCIQRD